MDAVGVRIFLFTEEVSVRSDVLYAATIALQIRWPLLAILTIKDKANKGEESDNQRREDVGRRPWVYGAAPRKAQ
jgi:hypothetical protein